LIALNVGAARLKEPSLPKTLATRVCTWNRCAEDLSRASFDVARGFAIDECALRASGKGDKERAQHISKIGTHSCHGALK
jgi:hypothetical protein